MENMPVMKKEFELNNGTKIMVRQASGLEKLKLETRQAKVFRKLRHFGPNPSEWSEKQQEEFALALDEAGCGLTSEELRELLGFVRGDDLDGAIPLGN